MPTTVCVLIISVYDGDTSSYFKTTILLFFCTFYCAIFRFVFLCIAPVISSYDNHTSSQGYKIMLGSIFLLPGNNNTSILGNIKIILKLIINIEWKVLRKIYGSTKTAITGDYESRENENLEQLLYIINQISKI